RADAYPRRLDVEEKIRLVTGIFSTWQLACDAQDGLRFSFGDSLFDFGAMSVTGPVTAASERARNILRRHGIRFKVDTDTGVYQAWEGAEELCETGEMAERLMPPGAGGRRP